MIDRYPATVAFTALCWLVAGLMALVQGVH